MALQRFSRRFGYSKPAGVSSGVPHNFHYALLHVLKASEAKPDWIRSSVCGHLRCPENFENARDQDIWKEIEAHLNPLEWFQTFDVIERVYADLVSEGRTESAHRFEGDLNDYFFDNGVGWQLQAGQFQVRGGETFQRAVETAIALFQQTDRSRAGTEIHEAFRDLSRRPVPDSSGAVQHAMASLECVAREASGDSKATLGDILKRYPGLLPKPLDTALEKVWGYSSEHARHGREGEIVPPDDAELIVSLAAAAATYLLRKIPNH